MKANKVEGRSGLAGCIVHSIRTMIEKRAEEICRAIISGARAIRPADTCAGHGAAYRVGRKVIELEVFLRRSMPIENVRLVPNFPVPGFYCRVAVPFAQVLRKL